MKNKKYLRQKNISMREIACLQEKNAGLRKNTVCPQEKIKIYEKK